jgi:ABC-type polysaccharide/polyol phosphate transport system ATPase subunit
MSDDIAIQVDHLWKSYGLLPSLRAHWDRRWQSQEKRSLWALRDVSFDVNCGEALGIIGSNGAGKSTLLKVLAGVSPATRGKVSAHGRVFPMIELNAGMHFELTGRENVRLLGALMGLTKREVQKKMPEIEEFTELGEWFDQPVRKYSSGMLARLGFAVALKVDANILLVDEVLAVGDVGFQNRCLEQMKIQRENGKTVMIVSHAMELVQYLCDRVILIDKGSIAYEGKPEKIITAYENLQYGRDSDYRIRQLMQNKNFSDTARFNLINVEMTNEAGEKTRIIGSRSEIRVIFECESSYSVSDLLFTFGLVNQRHETCIWEVIEGDKLGSFQPRRFNLTVVVPPTDLSGGSYSVSFAVRSCNSYETLGRYKGLSPFVIHSKTRERGVLTVPLQWKVDSLK